jgi:hypothetical protein
LRREGITVNIAEVGEMTKYLMALSFLLLTGIYGSALGTHYEVEHAWAGGTNNPPTTYEPQTLADWGDELNLTEREKMWNDDGDWYAKRHVKDWLYIMYTWDTPEELPNFEEAMFRWQVKIYSGEKISLYYWSSPDEMWCWLATNAGGFSPYPPPTKYTDVIDCYGAEKLILLAVGYDFDHISTAIYCDVGDITTAP